MRINLKHIRKKLLAILRFKPLSLAAKCRIAFGAAVVFVLAIALLLPYIWMGQLIKKDLLDMGRARSQALINQHFQQQNPGQTLPALDNAGKAMDVNDPDMRWIRFAKDGEDVIANSGLTEWDSQTIESLKVDDVRNDSIMLSKEDGVLKGNYVQIIRATDRCISCHNPQGSASPYSLNEPIGAAVVRFRGIGSEISKTKFLNLVWVIVAGLIGGIGAVVAFYWITQRVILRPIRQLRAIANNVSEGNLDIRSSIKTGDEYEKLADAFNNMLDGLQAAQEKLRQANKQLDAKIAELS
jgi:two-component system sensor histidine kinase BarA